jgi:hypothetical protein
VEENLSQLANFQSDDDSYTSAHAQSEISFYDFNDAYDEEELLLTDEGSETDPLGMEVLEAPMFNLLLNIYN